MTSARTSVVVIRIRIEASESVKRPNKVRLSRNLGIDQTQYARERIGPAILPHPPTSRPEQVSWHARPGNASSPLALRSSPSASSPPRPLLKSVKERGRKGFPESARPPWWPVGQVERTGGSPFRLTFLPILICPQTALHSIPFVRARERRRARETGTGGDLRGRGIRRGRLPLLHARGNGCGRTRPRCRP